MKSITRIVCALLLFISLCSSMLFKEEIYQTSWIDFKLKYSKSYGNIEEHDMRFNIFKKNMDYIHTFNLEKKSFTLGINQFADLTSDEFKLLHMKRLPHTRGYKNLPNRISSRDNPYSWDWREHGINFTVINEGQCASNWAYIPVKSIEACHFINTGKLVDLSLQQIIDCTQGNSGCNGGQPVSVLEYVFLNGGIDSEKCYPFEHSGGQCRYKKECCESNMTTYYLLTDGKESMLEDSVVQSPVACGIDASHSSFQFYQKGIYYEPACSSTDLDLMILVVGYATDTSGYDYWIAMNTWGTSWGMNGYVYMSRNKNNNCGIASYGMYPGGCTQC